MQYFGCGIGRIHTGSGSVPDSSEPTRTVRVGSFVCNVNANPTGSRPDVYGSLESGTEPDPV